MREQQLLINGRWDMVEDITCEGYFRHIKQIKWITFDNASHTPMWEDRERYMKLVEDFLTHSRDRYDSRECVLIFCDNNGPIWSIIP